MDSLIQVMADQESNPKTFGWNHVLDFGLYKGKFLSAVPESYIEWIVWNKVYLGKTTLKSALEQLKFVGSETSHGSCIAASAKTNTNRRKSNSKIHCNSSQANAGSQVFVYILQLQHGKWYVGITENMERRMLQHMSSTASSWTRLYPVVRVHEVSAVADESKVGVESRRVAELMWRHGVNQVRGAEHCNTRPFDISDKENLVRFVGHHLELDFREVGHWLESQLMSPSAKSRSSRSTSWVHCSAGSWVSPAFPCFRCGRSSHWASDCFANFHVDGRQLDTEEHQSDPSVDVETRAARHHERTSRGATPDQTFS